MYRHYDDSSGSWHPLHAFPPESRLSLGLDYILSLLIARDVTVRNVTYSRLGLLAGDRDAR